MKLEEYTSLHLEFGRLDYYRKLALFDQCFGLIPFEFPAFNPAVSWYGDTGQMDALVSIFHAEKKDARLLYRRTIVEGSEIFAFNIQPVLTTERDIFHSFVIQKLLKEKRTIREALEKELLSSRNPATLIEEKISVIIHTLQWIREVTNSSERSFPALFLQIFNNGLQAVGEELNSKTKVRRKYIELYLYVQGLLLAYYYRSLADMNKNLQKSTVPIPLNLTQKITLLQQTGILDFLKLQDRQTDRNVFPSIISLLTAEDNIDYQNVCEMLDAIGTRKPKDPITRENSVFVRKQIDRFNRF